MSGRRRNCNGCEVRTAISKRHWQRQSASPRSLFYSLALEFSPDGSAFATRAIAGSAHEFCCVRRISGIGEYIARIIRKDGSLADPRLVQSSSSFAQHCRGSIGGGGGGGSRDPGAPSGGFGVFLP